MHLIIIPGNSKEYNEQWLHDSAKAYADLFDSVTKHVFKHWETGEEMIDYDVEVEKLTKEAEKLEGNYVIFAKSAGTITTVKALDQGKITPEKCIFVGNPWKGLDGELKNFNIPTLFIQQTDDMFFKYADLEETINGKKIKEFKLIEIPGSNHAYDNYEEIKQWVKEFLEA